MPSTSPQSSATTSVALLSYNINLLPFGKQHIPSHANKDERMAQFISLVSNGRSSSSSYSSLKDTNATASCSPCDILALQEVYGSPFLPSFAVPTLCRQTRLIEQLRTRGFPYHAACEQPSFLSMISKRTFTDSGLVILSKHPIEHVGSVAFSPPHHAAQSMTRRASRAGNDNDDDGDGDFEEKSGDVTRMDEMTTLVTSRTAESAGQPGCLFAAIRLPASACGYDSSSTRATTASTTTSSSSASPPLLLVFNVHLSLCNRNEHRLFGSTSASSSTTSFFGDDDDDDTVAFSTATPASEKRRSRTTTEILPRKPNPSSCDNNNKNYNNNNNNNNNNGGVASNNSKKSNARDRLTLMKRAASSDYFFSDAGGDAIRHRGDFGLTQTQRSQVTELRHFIEGVLQQFPVGTAFVICGDFNVNALYQVDSMGLTRPSRAYVELKSMLTPLLSLPAAPASSSAGLRNIPVGRDGDDSNSFAAFSSSVVPAASSSSSCGASQQQAQLAQQQQQQQQQQPDIVQIHEALLDSLGYHPATRPVSAASQLADSPFSSYVVGGVARAKTQYRLHHLYHVGGGMLRSQEMRHDYIFFGCGGGGAKGASGSTTISLSEKRQCRIERFSMPEGSFPFRFLSDHFALIANFEISSSSSSSSSVESNSRQNTPSKGPAPSLSGAANEKSDHRQDQGTSKNPIQPRTRSIVLQQLPSVIIAEVENTLHSSPAVISLFNAFSSLLATIFFFIPQDVRYQRSGVRVPVGAAEVLVFAIMIVALPLWVVASTVTLVLALVAAFFFLIQKKATKTTRPWTAKGEEGGNNEMDESETTSDFLDVAKVQGDTVSGKVPILVTGKTGKTLLSLHSYSPSSPSPKSSSSSTRRTEEDDDEEEKRSLAFSATGSKTQAADKSRTSSSAETTIAELWHEAVSKSSWLPCLGPSLFLSHCYSHGWLDQPFAHDETSVAEVVSDFHHSFLTYSEADRLALSLANGMLALCASLPEVQGPTTASLLVPLPSSSSQLPPQQQQNTTTYRVGVLLQSCPMSLLLDLAFLAYGHICLNDVYELPNIAPLIAVPLVGESNALRTELDDSGCSVAITTVSQAKLLLTCHARHLHTVIVVPDEPFFFLQQQSAGYNPVYHHPHHLHHHNNNNNENNSHAHQRGRPRQQQQQQYQQQYQQQQDQQRPFKQEINVPVLAGAAASLLARDVSSIPSSLELLATENSIQLVSMGELLHNGCILTREGRFQQQHHQNQNQQQNTEEEVDGESSQSQSQPSSSSYFNNRIPRPDDFAMIMLDCRSTEGSYVSVASPFHTKKHAARFDQPERLTDNDDGNSPLHAPIYGRLIRLTHKNIARFVTQISETGVVPSPSWSCRNNNNNNSRGGARAGDSAGTSSSSSSAPTIVNSQSRILFQDVHNSYFERWSALCTVLSGHIAVVTRNNVASIPISAEIASANSIIAARAFHGSCIALKPHIAFTSLLPAIATRDIYDKIVSAGFSRFHVVQNIWSFAFRNMVRLRDQLGERDFDSAFVYRTFFRWITTTFFGTRIRRVVIASDEAVPYRVRHLLQLLLLPQTTAISTTSGLSSSGFLTVSFAPNVGIVHINGTPPPRTLIRILKREGAGEEEDSTGNGNSNICLAGEIDVSGPVVLGVDKDSGGFASSGLIGEWHRRQKKSEEQQQQQQQQQQHQQHFSATVEQDNASSLCRWTLQVLCPGDSLVRPGTVLQLQKMVSEALQTTSALLGGRAASTSSNAIIHEDEEDEEEGDRQFFASLVATQHRVLFHRRNQPSIAAAVTTATTTTTTATIPFVSASSLERCYVQECSSIINDLMIWCNEGFPLVAVVVPNRPVLLELLVSRISELRLQKLLTNNQLHLQQQQQQKQQQQQRRQQKTISPSSKSEGGDNEDVDDDDDDDDDASELHSPVSPAPVTDNATDDELLQLESETALLATLHADPSILFRSDVAKEVVLRACHAAFVNAGLSHEILGVHLHPHPFGAHNDFARANGTRRRSRMVEYFLVDVEKVYFASIREMKNRIIHHRDLVEAKTRSSHRTSDASATQIINADDVAGAHCHDRELSSPNAVSVTRQPSAVVASNLNNNNSSDDNLLPDHQSSHGVETGGWSNAATSTRTIHPVAPFAVDIGGTCAKIVFFLPGDADPRGLIPGYCTIEKNDPATAFLGAAVDPFAVQEMMSDAAVARYGHNNNNKSNTNNSTNNCALFSCSTTGNAKKKKPFVATSPVSGSYSPSFPVATSRAKTVSFRLVCMKLPTSMVSRFVQHLATAPILPPSSPTAVGPLFSSSSSSSSPAPTFNQQNNPLPLLPATASTSRSPINPGSNIGNTSTNRIETDQQQQQHVRTQSSSTSTSQKSGIRPPPPPQGPSSASSLHLALPPPTSFVLPSLLASSSMASSKLAFMFKKEALQRIPATGGGAFRFQGAARSQLGIGLDPVKEMESLVKGLNILLDRCPDLAVFSYDTKTHTQARHKLSMTTTTTTPTTVATAAAANPQSLSNHTVSPSLNLQAGTAKPESSGFSPYPFLLVNVGSGVSIVKLASGDGSFVRVGGSPVGGATFWGLARALTSIHSWEELREITRVDGPGDHTKVDLLVGDIYGYNATALPAGLSVDTLASSFGKMASRNLGDDGGADEREARATMSLSASRRTAAAAAGGGGAAGSSTVTVVASGAVTSTMIGGGSVAVANLNRNALSQVVGDAGVVDADGASDAIALRFDADNENEESGPRNVGGVDRRPRGPAFRTSSTLLDDDDTAELLDWNQETIQMATPKAVTTTTATTSSSSPATVEHRLLANSKNPLNDENGNQNNIMNISSIDSNNNNNNNFSTATITTTTQSGDSGGQPQPPLPPQQQISASTASANTINSSPQQQHQRNVSSSAQSHRQYQQQQQQLHNQLSSVDVIRSLLMMVATNITQIAYLYAKQEGVKNILFTGGFVRGNALVWSRMTFALNYWSSGQMTAHFLKNDGYVGVLGALLNTVPALNPSSILCAASDDPPVGMANEQHSAKEKNHSTNNDNNNDDDQQEDKAK